MTEGTIDDKVFKRPEFSPFPDLVPLIGLYTYSNRLRDGTYSSFFDFLKRFPREIAEFTVSTAVSDVRGLLNPSTRKERAHDIISLSSYDWPWKEQPRECELTALQNVFLVCYHSWAPLLIALDLFG